MNLKTVSMALSFMNVELAIGPIKKELPQIRKAILNLKFCQEREGRGRGREIGRDRGWGKENGIFI